ncbi:hypothetical protein JW906_03415 [bacterium]|nr:hypothetical protein [bacterium]
MKKGKMLTVFCATVLILIMIFSGCCSMNRLQNVAFRERTVSALAAHPPAPEIFTDDWTDVDLSNPVRAAIGIGTGIAKEVEVAKTRAKMDSAMSRVNIPETMRAEILKRGAPYLHYSPVEDTDASDFLFDVIIRRYGIEAKSWTAGVHFKMDAKIVLLDNRKDRVIWRSCFDEKMPVSPDIFGLPSSAGNIITMMSLSRLTAEQIADGLDHLAVYTSDRIIHKLQKDFLKKNQ